MLAEKSYGPLKFGKIAQNCKKSQKPSLDSNLQQSTLKTDALALWATVSTSVDKGVLSYKYYISIVAIWITEH